jgi:hypothetical protein
LLLRFEAVPDFAPEPLRFLVAGFFAAGFFAAGFFAAGFFAADFFVEAGFFAAVFFAADFFVEAGFFAAVFFAAGFLAPDFLAFGAGGTNSPCGLAELRISATVA